nr:MAG TPA: hypothetical protein [Caudoviricetes sp.]
MLSHFGGACAIVMAEKICTAARAAAKGVVLYV